MKSLETTITEFYGPSLYFDKPCVAVFFDHDFVFGEKYPIQFSDFQENLKFFPSRIISYLNELNKFDGPQHLIAVLANAIQCERYKMPLSYDFGRTEYGKSYISISYYSCMGAKSALAYSFNFVKNSLKGIRIEDEVKRNKLNIILQEQKILQPDQTSSAMLNAAKTLKIPVYEIFETTRILCYGQGENSLLFKSASNELDSSVGVELQQNKAETNRLIRLMGYPTTEHYVVNNIEQAKQAQSLLGYPLAVKPVSSGMGYGVSSNVSSEQELTDSFYFAQKYQKNILIEKHVYGFDHRITVADGRVIGAICRLPAMVIGDGERTITELIIEENNNRPDEMRQEGLIRDIVVDENLLTIIRKDGFSLESIPDKNKKIILRSNANISTGGTFKDVIENMHSDIEKMAIDVAKYFRLNVIGLDFMSRDISRSWKEEGVIIEVNSPPGILEELALSQLRFKFSTRNNGRVPTYLLVDLSKEQEIKIIKDHNIVTNKLSSIGEGSTIMSGSERIFLKSSLAQQCVGFLIDPSCQALMVAETSRNLLEKGFPIDYFEYCFLNKKTEELSDNGQLINLLKKYCGNLIFV